MNPATLKLKKVENRSAHLGCSNLSTIEIPIDKKGEMTAVTQSPPRHLSAEEKAAWIIPASVSNWKA